MPVTRITLTLPDDLLALVDRYVEEHAGTTRSSVCTDALREWLCAKQEAEVAAYYLSQSDAERAEDADWAATASESAPALLR